MRQAIRTERLLLEPQGLRHFDEWFVMEKARDEPGHRDLSEDQAWLRLCARQGMWDAFGRGFYAVREARRNALIGEVGFQFRRRGYGTQFEGFPEAAWAIDARHQGKGLGHEAMRTVLDRHDKCSPGGKTVALIEATNLPSLRLAERLGFLRFERVTSDGVDHCLLARNVQYTHCGIIQSASVS